VFNPFQFHPLSPLRSFYSPIRRQTFSISLLA
jgi:hypothetical protein